MVTASSLPIAARRSLVRPIVLGGICLFIGQFLQTSIVYGLLQGSPFLSIWQYLASGILGMAAFEGGIAIAVLGLFIHLIFSVVIAGVFVLAADRIPLLRRHPIAGSLLYGFGVFVVMNMIVIPLSAAPPLPPPALPWLIEAVIEHVVVVGLPLGIIVQRNAIANR
jgi:uncharacterized membrane protein